MKNKEIKQTSTEEATKREKVYQIEKVRMKADRRLTEWLTLIELNEGNKELIRHWRIQFTTELTAYVQIGLIDEMENRRYREMLNELRKESNE